MYYDAYKVLPFARTCPAPWQGGKDPKCLLCNPANTYTGPEETWWCPYDNRPGSTVTAGLPGGSPPAGTLSPFVENSVRVFRCPDATDQTPGSPTRGAAFQVSYAINPDVGGKKISEARGIWVVEHDDLPVCRGPADHFTMWQADSSAKAQRHDPKRHAGQANSLYYDGSVPYGQ
jgi:prepilin-type processing-associated H-X9-DG protein